MSIDANSAKPISIAEERETGLKLFGGFLKTPQNIIPMLRPMDFVR
jgi:hypothetical protein